MPQNARCRTHRCVDSCCDMEETLTVSCVCRSIRLGNGPNDTGACQNGKRAIFCDTLKKGAVHVEGELCGREYDDV
jgi:hypothetical protein